MNVRLVDTGVSHSPRWWQVQDSSILCICTIWVDKRDIGFNWKILGVLSCTTVLGVKLLLVFWWGCQSTYEKNMAPLGFLKHLLGRSAFKLASNLFFFTQFDVNPPSLTSRKFHFSDFWGGKEKQKLNSSLSCTIGPGLWLVRLPNHLPIWIGWFTRKKPNPWGLTCGFNHQISLISLLRRVLGLPAPRRSYQDFQELGMV